MKKSFSPAPLLSVVLVCLYPCAFYFFQNAGEARAADMLPVLGLFLLTGLVLLGLGWGITRRFAAGALFSGLAMVLVVNGGLISQFLKGHLGFYRDRYLLLLAVMLMVLLLVLLCRKKAFPAKECCLILLILFGSLTAIGLVRAAPTLYEVYFARPEPSEIDPDTVALSGDTPNVYYLILDEYGGSENLQRYYDFDNHEFLGFLEDRGFNLSHSSKNTESIWTSTLVPNLLNLDYVAEDDLPERVKLRLMENPPLFRLFRDAGYTIHLINHKDFIGTEGCTVLSPDQFPDRITDYVFDGSLYATVPYLRDYLKDILGLQDNLSHASHVQEIFDTMETCADQVGDGPTLTVSYVQCPHYPFVFDAQGNVVNGGHDIRDRHYYLDQLSYTNSILETTISKILEKDPDSIIVLQSDHGARYPGQMLLFYGAPEYDPYLETPYMQNVLNCVYYRGEVLGIEGETGINTWRKLLNTAYGTDFAALTPPEGYTCYGRSWNEPPEVVPSPTTESAP